MSVVVAARVPDLLAEQMRVVAEREERSLSSLVRLAVEDFVGRLREPDADRMVDEGEGVPW